MEEKINIGFIGIGVMGRSMALHLIEKGYTVFIYNRTKSKAEDVINKGGIWKDTVAELAKVSDVIITIVGYPRDVEEIYFNEQGILQHAKCGSLTIDMTTSEPSLAKKIYEEAKKLGIHSLDAPVSGGDIGARNATLTIMVGGDEESFIQAKPILECMGKNIVWQGEAGSGQHTKMCNQITIASNMVGVCEAMVYAEKAGLNPETVLKSIGAGAAGSWSLSNLAPRMIEGDFEPGFYVKHFIKDMSIALAEAQAMGLKTPGLELVLNLYEQLAQAGQEDKGTQVLYQLIRDYESK